MSQANKKKKSKQAVFKQLYAKALRFLGYRPRSRREITDYLNKRLKKLQLSQSCPWRQEVVDQVIDRLRELALVDDQEFAQWWIDQRLEFRPRGRKLLSHELYQKGLKRSVINQALAGINSKRLKAAAKRLVLKKAKTYPDLPLKEKKQKLLNHLNRRGFKFSLAKEIIDELTLK